MNASSSTSCEKLTQLLHRIQIEGEKYGLKPNHDKCEAMAVRGTTEIYYLNGEKVKELDESRYLGCFLIIETNAKRELNKRMGDVHNTWKRLEAFWKHSDCEGRFKIIAYNAVIRTKLMYGLESLQLLQEDINSTEDDDADDDTFYVQYHCNTSIKRWQP